MLLSIVAVAFASLFSNGNKFVFASGDRIKYTQTAASAMEKFYSVNAADMGEADFSSYVLSNFGSSALISTYESVNNYTPGKNIKISRQMAVPTLGANGCWITVTVFFRDGSQHSSLTSFFRKEG